MAKMVLRTYEEENKRRRNLRFFWIIASIPVIAIIFLYGFKTFLMFEYAEVAIDQFNKETYLQEIAVVDQLKTANITQPWIAYYNSGTLRVAGSETVEGVEELKQALTLVGNEFPGECYVRANLAIGYEHLGDEQKEKRNNLTAAGYYILAERTIAEANPACFPSGNSSGQGEDDNSENSNNDETDENENTPDGGAGESMNNTQERLDEKQGKDGDNNSPSQPEENPNGTPEPSKEDIIRDQTEQVDKERADEENYRRGQEEEGEGSPSTDRPW